MFSIHEPFDKALLFPLNHYGPYSSLVDTRYNRDSLNDCLDRELRSLEKGLKNLLIEEQSLESVKDYLDFLIRRYSQLKSLSWKNLDVEYLDSDFAEECEGIANNAIQRACLIAKEIREDSFGEESIPVVSKYTFKGKKADLVLLLNALWECDLIETQAGEIPSKGDFIPDMLEMFGQTRSFKTNLNQSLSKTVTADSLLEIFETLREKTRQIYYDTK